MLVSDQKRVDEARIWRKRHGAGMRQVGILAAAAHYALDNNLKDLARDHEFAQKLAAVISTKNSSVIDPKKVHTNIVALNLATTRWSAQALGAELKKHGVIAGALGPTFLRLVTHRDLSESDIDVASQIIADLI